MTTLADKLHWVDMLRNMTILYTGYPIHKPPDVEFWVGYYTAKGIHVVALPETGVSYDVPIDVAIAHRYVYVDERPAVVRLRTFLG